jgi:hypothetical protein
MSANSALINPRLGPWHDEACTSLIDSDREIARTNQISASCRRMKGRTRIVGMYIVIKDT